MLHTGPPRCAAARAPVPEAGHCWPLPPQETLKHSKAGLAQSLVGSGAHRVLFEPSESLWRIWGLILKVILPLLQFCWGFSFALGHGISSLVGSNILLLMVVQQRVAILEFSQEKMSAL